MSDFPDPITWRGSLGVRQLAPAWQAVVRALYGTPPTDQDRAILPTVTGGVLPGPGRILEWLGVAGRRGNKTETAGTIATFECLHGGHEVALAPGQVGVFAVVCPLREQAGEMIRYVKGLAALPAVARRVTRDTADGVEFGQVAIKIMTADAIALSGATCVGAILDEAAKLPGDEAAMPDHEIVRSLRPALAPVRGAPPRMFGMLTSAYLDSGIAYETEKANYGKDGAEVFCFRGPTTLFNPAIDRAWLERERTRDPMGFAREYECQWSSSITEGWFGSDNIERSIDGGRTSPMATDAPRVVAIDAAFRGDSFAVAVGHAEEQRGRPPFAVIDLVEAWTAPKGGSLSPEACVARVADLCRRWHVHEVLADQFAADPLREIFERHGLTMTEKAWTASSKPIRYRRVRQAMVDGLLRLPDDAALLRELRNIRGRLLRGGGESIEAATGHDDRVSAAVLVASEVLADAGHENTFQVIRAGSRFGRPHRNPRALTG